MEAARDVTLELVQRLPLAEGCEMLIEGQAWLWQAESAQRAT